MLPEIRSYLFLGNNPPRWRVIKAPFGYFSMWTWTNAVCVKGHMVWTPSNKFCVCGHAKNMLASSRWFGRDFPRMGATSRERSEVDLLPERRVEQWPREQLLDDTAASDSFRNAASNVMAWTRTSPSIYKSSLLDVCNTCFSKGRWQAIRTGVGCGLTRLSCWAAISCWLCLIMPLKNGKYSYYNNIHRPLWHFHTYFVRTCPRPSWKQHAGLTSSQEMMLSEYI